MIITIANKLDLQIDELLMPLHQSVESFNGWFIKYIFDFDSFIYKDIGCFVWTFLVFFVFLLFIREQPEEMNKTQDTRWLWIQWELCRSFVIVNFFDMETVQCQAERWLNDKWISVDLNL